MQLPDHRKLLTHPVISSFLGLKWARIKRYYYANLVAYVAFVACLTAYLVTLNEELDGRDSKKKNATLSGKDSSGEKVEWSGVSALTLILLITLAIREVFQALVSFR